MTRQLLPLALLACSACASNPHEWRLEGIAVTNEATAIRASFDAWCERSEGTHCDRITGDGDSVVKLLPRWSTALGHVATESDQGGNWTSITIRIALNRDAPDWLAQLQWVTLHELGHWYRGLDGHLGAGNVMAPCRGSAAVHLTEADLTDEYWQVEGCGE